LLRRRSEDAIFRDVLVVQRYGKIMNKANNLPEKERVIAYIDGFNLYFGIKEAKFEKFKWLDVKAMISKLLNENQTLVEIKYFTSRVSNNPEKQKRQTIYLEALELSGVKLFFGHYQTTKISCKSCGSAWANYNEKMTDVNIATQMLVDAYDDKYDMAMLISGDSDLVPPMIEIHKHFNNKRVFVAFPPARQNNTVKIHAKGILTIGRKTLADSQLPETIAKPNGYILKKPREWFDE